MFIGVAVKIVSDEQERPTILGTARGGEAEDVGGSNPFTPTKNKSKPFGFGLFFCFEKGIRTREGLSVKKTVLWTVFSEEREAGTERFALGRRAVSMRLRRRRRIPSLRPPKYNLGNTTEIP